jgi:PEP-CTERM motif
MRLPTRILALFIAAVCATTARADVIIGNMAGVFNDSGTASGISGPTPVSGGVYSNKGIGFTMGLDSYSVSSVTLRLAGFNAVTADDRPTVSIWTNSGVGNGGPGTLVGSFTNPVSFSDTAANHVFTPASSITLVGGQTYFLVVQQLTPLSTGVDNSFQWLNSSPTIVPTGIASAYIIPGTTPIQGGRFSNSTGTNPTAMTNTSGNYNLFQLEGTVIPEPSSVAALAGLAALGLVAVRRRRR